MIPVLRDRYSFYALDPIGLVIDHEELSALHYEAQTDHCAHVLHAALATLNEMFPPVPWVGDDIPF